MRRAKRLWLQVECIGCGRAASEVVCSDCLEVSGGTSVFRPLPYPVAQLVEEGFFLGPYAFDGRPTPVARALLRFKYGGDRACGHFLKQLFFRAIPTIASPFDVVVPVPLHRRRLRERGYNQAAWLARAGAKGLGAALEPRALIRIRDTPPQAQASGPDRRTSVANAFHARRRLVQDRRVLLVDDVYTTGTTATEAARALASVGAAGIGVAVLLAALRDP